MKNMVKLLMLTICLVFGGTFASLTASEEDILVSLRFYRGVREAVEAPENFVSAHYLKKNETEPAFSGEAILQEMKTLKRVFNLTNVRLKSAAYMALGTDPEAQQAEVNLANGREVKGRLTLIDRKKGLFRVEVLDGSRRGPALLDTEAVMPKGQKAVLGFEDSAGKIYFLSFQWEMEIPQRNRLTYRVEPEYPTKALEERLQGTVVLKAETDRQGNVVHVMVVEDHPIFTQSAKAALMQWKYEPYVIDGQATPVAFTVAFDFQLRQGSVDKGSGRLKPWLLHRVNPAYPNTALKAMLKGTVVVEVEIGPDGSVINARVLRGHPLLNGAALRAVRQWKYEPNEALAGGKTVKVTETIRFELKY
jgi:TonB family protein